MTQQTTESHALLEARDLTKHYRVKTGRFRTGIVHAAENINIRLDPGTVTAVVGESGSGKSTLTRLLARTQQLTSGELLYQGKPVTAQSAQDYRAAVQLVLQDPFASLNPAHNIRYILGRPLQIHGLAGDNLEQSILGLLRRVALEPAEQFIDKYPYELSGGQRQRVSIARGLAVQPKVLIADEPVSMLDVSIRLGVLNLLADLRDRDRIAILYVTHDIASARYLADTVMVMYAGRVVEYGTADEVVNSPAHPYTQLLLSAAPDPESPTKTWQGASGAPPSLVNPPPGCRFNPRCPSAMDVCRETLPPTLAVLGLPAVRNSAADADEQHTDGAGRAAGAALDGHHAACWLHSPEHRRDAQTAETGGSQGP